jgi:protein O-mannosyl-transferase
MGTRRSPGARWSSATAGSRAPAHSPLSRGARVQIGGVVTAPQTIRGGQGLPSPKSSWSLADWAGIGILVAAAAAAYFPAMRAGFIWDDNAHVIRADLRSLHGLLRIWTQPGTTQQYYPVLYSAFWLEHRAWGDLPAPYHIANIALHAAAACLLLRLLGRLAVPGAFLAAAVFALHPVNVETVAWVSEQKNTLSAVFYLCAALAYLRFDEGRLRRWFAAGTALFALALLSKSVTATLPAALLVIIWWKRGRLSPRADVAPISLWLVLGAAMGCVTAWFERTHVGASGAPFDLGLGERVLVAGRALWFYLAKILWPTHLTFIYPRWHVDASSAFQYLYPASAVALLGYFWAIRARTRAPLAAALLFAGTLFPALGFVNLFPFLYSYVADHFQYLAMAAVVASASAGASLAARHWAPAVGRVASIILVAGLGALTWRQCAMYSDSESLWRATIERNPGCWMAYNNLAVDLLGDGKIDEAVAAVEAGLRLEPGNAAAHATLGEAYSRQGHADQAVSEFSKALELEPFNAAAHINLADVLLAGGHLGEAEAHFKAALEIVPYSGKAKGGLGELYLRQGNMDKATDLLGKALDDDPSDVSAHSNLGTVLMMKNRVDEATVQYQLAVSLNPRLLIAQYNLGNALLQSGFPGKAAEHLRVALEISPDMGQVHDSLGYALLKSGHADEAISHFRRALELDPGDARARGYLDEALGPRK